MSPSSILLRGGIVLQHDAEDQVHALRDTDLLIQGDRIAKIGKGLDVDGDVQIIDCTNKIVSPGFVDCHHHVWQSQLKGRHSDDTHLDYMVKGNMQSYNYTPEDVLWGQLGGCLEALDAGTTCIVDQAHMTYSADHARAGLSATIASGVRSIFCCSLISRFKTWNEHVAEPAFPFVPDWFMPLLQDLTSKQPYGQGRVWLGFAIDAFFLPQEVLIDIFNKVRKFGVKVITSHFVKNNYIGNLGPSIPEHLHAANLLGPDILLAHATGSSPQDLHLLKAAGASICSTPDTEAHMGHGDILSFRSSSNVNGCLGADCHSNNSSSLLHALRTGLAVTRAQRSSQIIASGKFPRHIRPTTLEGFNLATIKGARAIGMESEIGTLAEGKLADVVLFDAGTPGMAVAAAEDPLVAVVRFAGDREVDTVIVGGRIRKEGGKLCDVDVGGSRGLDWMGERKEDITQKGKLSWEAVAEQLLRSRTEIQERIARSSPDAARKAFLGAIKVEESIFVDE